MTRSLAWYASVLFSFALAGCGGDGLDRRPVSGRVTYLGKPVEFGAIVFEPNESVGQIAPMGSARIENGEFQTAADQSPIKGAYRVRIMGYDKSKIKGDRAAGEAVEIPELFPEYRTEVEIPTPDGRLDVDVPERPRGKQR